MIGQRADSRDGFVETAVPHTQSQQKKTMPRRSFEEVVMPHLDAAFNYARWDAEDVVQDAYVRAFKSFSSFRDDDARCWLLTTVRNAWYGRFPRRAAGVSVVKTDEDGDDRPDESLNSGALVIQQETVERVRRALEELPAEFREILVLRELEGLSHKEIAAVVTIPIGTVMSRLARGRERLFGLLAACEAGGRDSEVARVLDGLLQ
jgi:RNA polymerase sigma factor (sigma-70 family)